MRLLAAAQRAGIGITLLPVLYQDAGFGGLPPRADQRRFINSVDGLLRIVERMPRAGRARRRGAALAARRRARTRWTSCSPG